MTNFLSRSSSFRSFMLVMITPTDALRLRVINFYEQKVENIQIKIIFLWFVYVPSTNI